MTNLLQAEYFKNLFPSADKTWEGTIQMIIKFIQKKKNIGQKEDFFW